MHRVLCFGGRNYSNYNFIINKLNELHILLGDFIVITGGAKGADELCGTWGKQKGLPVITVDANWFFYGKAAGAVRNKWMIDFCLPTYAVGFPGGNGTKDMASRIALAKIPFIEYSNRV